MDHSRLLAAILHNQERLIATIAFEDPDDRNLYGLHLQFTNKSFYITASADYDEIIVSSQKPLILRDNDLQPRRHPGLLANAYGKTLSWYWWMTNQQGYQDGLQLEFGIGETVSCMQAIAIATCLSIRSTIPDTLFSHFNS